MQSSIPSASNGVRCYREPFVWLLIAFPATAVVVGFTLLGLAIYSDDGMVEDDYYRKGKEINRVLARDQAAAKHGLESTLAFDTAKRELQTANRTPGRKIAGANRASVPARHPRRSRPEHAAPAQFGRRLPRAVAAACAGPLERAARGPGLAPDGFAVRARRAKIVIRPSGS